MRRALVVALVLLGVRAGPAEAYLRLAADAAGQRGHITLFVEASAKFKTGILAERVGDGYQAINDFTFAYRGVDPEHGPIGQYIEADAARWRCDRLAREFAVIAYTKDGAVDTSSFSLRTPSCRTRLALLGPRRVPAGDDVTASVYDTWGLGATEATVCFASRPCRTLALASDQAEVSTVFRNPATGLRRLTLRAPAQRIRLPVAVGVPPPSSPATPTILTTGDSMMQTLDAILEDRFDDEANVLSDVHTGTGLTVKPDDWSKWARQRVASQPPDAVVMFLGANDVYDMTTPAGDPAPCCGAAWRAEYARRAGRLMRIYARGGRATVLWLLLPAMEDPRRRPAVDAVNAALRTAAARFPTVQIVDPNDLLTPGGRYRAILHGVHIREPDGIHLTAAGARLLIPTLRTLLTTAGLLPQRPG